MESADYGRASSEEREKVVIVLRRNVDRIVAKKVVPEAELRLRAEELARRVENGEVITGRAYKELLALLQGHWPVA